VPDDVTNAVEICAGAGFTGALLPDGTVRLWGSNSSGQCNLPDGIRDAAWMSASSIGGAVVVGQVRSPGGVAFLDAPAPIDQAGAAPVEFDAGAVNAGRPVVVQWLRDDDAAAGQTNLTLRLPAPRRRDSGDYRPIVTSLAGSSTGPATRVTIRIPQRLRLVLEDGVLRVRFSDEDGEPMLPGDAPGFSVWTSPDLGPDSWTPLPAPVSFDAGELTAPDDPVEPGAPRFYRVIETP
jgi:hypothetical protein